MEISSIPNESLISVPDPFSEDKRSVWRTSTFAQFGFTVELRRETDKFLTGFMHFSRGFLCFFINQCIFVIYLLFLNVREFISRHCYRKAFSSKSKMDMMLQNKMYCFNLYLRSQYPFLCTQFYRSLNLYLNGLQLHWNIFALHHRALTFHGETSSLNSHVWVQKHFTLI